MLGSSGLGIFKDRSVTVYNPKNVSLSINNVLIENFSPEEIITIEFISDTCNFVKGIDGNTAIQKQSNFDAIVSISLLQTSQVNKQMLWVAEMFKESGQAAPLTFSDYNLGVSWHCPFAVMQKRTPMVYGSTMQSWRWQWYCPNIKISQQISSTNSMFSLEEILFEKIGKAIKSTGKTVSGLFK